MESKLIPFVAYESMQAKDERIIRRLIAAVIIATVLMFLTNLIWLWAWLQFDYYGQEVTVDANGGDANYIGNNGDINGETKGDRT